MSGKLHSLYQLNYSLNSLKKPWRCQNEDRLRALHGSHSEILGPRLVAHRSTVMLLKSKPKPVCNQPDWFVYSHFIEGEVLSFVYLYCKIQCHTDLLMNVFV